MEDDRIVWDLALCEISAMMSSNIGSRCYSKNAEQIIIALMELCETFCLVKKYWEGGGRRRQVFKRNVEL